ncbi:MAG: hypothetical protein ACK4IY_04305, partial [Chitinophagales bacterium]
GLADGEKGKFDCVGTYYDAADETTFENAMNVVISQALNNTTVQINLIDGYGKPTETDVELTFYDSFSGEVRYHFVHSLNAKMEPDTLLLDPVGKYDIVAHTTPSVVKKNIELNPGKHNIIGIETPQGILQLTELGNAGFSDKLCVVRNAASGEIIYVQNLNTTQKYIAGTYNIEVLTLPRLQYNNFEIQSGVTSKIMIDKAGILNVNASDNFLFSIYQPKDNDLIKIYEATLQKNISSIELLPGDYLMVYRSNTKKTAENTSQMMVNIKSNKTTNVQLK